MVIRAVLSVLLILITSSPKLQLSLSRRVLFRGDSITLTCSVPREDSNRLVRVGFSEYQISERDLHGSDSPVTFRFEFKKIPCEPGVPFCQVFKNTGDSKTVTSTIELSGCEAYDSETHRVKKHS